MKKRRQTLPFFESKLGPIMLRNILGPSFDATLDQVLTQPFDIFGPFSMLKICLNHYFIVFEQKIRILKPTPQKRGTLFVSTTALTDFIVCLFFLHFCFFFVFAVSGFWGVFILRGMKIQKRQNSKQNNKKRKKTTRCKQQNHLVLLLKKKNQTQTQNNTNQMSKMETNNTRKTNKNQNMKLKNYKLPCNQHD